MVLYNIAINYSFSNSLKYYIFNIKYTIPDWSDVSIMFVSSLSSLCGVVVPRTYVHYPQERKSRKDPRVPKSFA